MRMKSDKRPRRKHDRKVLMVEESTKSWADTDSDSSSSSSSSSDSEQEEVHCLMADQMVDDEDLTDFPKDNIFDARSLFPASKEQVSVSCFKKEMKIEYHLLHDILAKTLFVTAGSFDAVTRDRFLLMTAITFDVKVNWGSLLFGVLKAMVTPGSRKAKGFAIQIVHRFIHINEKVGFDESLASPRVKTTPVKKSVSKKRQVGAGEEAPLMKKKRTTKGKPVVIAQEAMPLQTVEATTIAPVEQLSVTKRKSQKRKRKFVLEDATVVRKSVDEMVERFDAPFMRLWNNQMWAETRFDRAFDEMLRDDSQVVTPSDTDEEEVTIDVGAAGGDQQLQFSAEGTIDDKSLSIEEHQARTPFNAYLPSTLAPTITPIRFGQGIEFREVDAYKASLPQIDASDKGKGILVEDDVQGHPAQEIFSLICADIEFLIALREKVIEDVSIFVSSFSLRKLATLQSEDIFAKEGQVLSWAETDSSFVAIQRRRLIIAKYRELLLRKFIEARRKNFVSGTPTSAIDLKVLKLLGAAHLFVLKVLLRHMREHQLEWTRPSSSSLFEGPVIDRGFFIPPNHHSITSKCWIRAKIMVDGSWLILEGVDYWRPINTPVNSTHWEALPQQPYLDDLAPPCVFIEHVQDIDSRPSLSGAISIVWADICMEAVQFSLLGSIRPVGSVNFCREIVVRGSVVEVIETLPIRFRRIIQQGINCNSFVDSVVQLDSAEIQEVDVQGIDEVDLVSSEGSESRPPTSPRQETSASSSSDSPVHLNGDDIPLEENNARQEGQNQDDLQILRLNELKKTVMAQGVTADTDSLAVRNRFNALDAKIILLDGQVAAIRSEQLEFQDKMAADLLSLSTQIGNLVDYIHGGDAKKGEGSSSRRPLPTPVSQGERSGNVIRTTEIISQTDTDAAQ
ncbi:hypothetical protein F511_14629 [Dorcoceras hygrometricum]|uniref:Uncharacterized protein n=1 Tax=Dorcoceras hygrometricum TaxID=472368 RepID=A0A2Z7A5T5_9LAMI|nr:hypothetical protein F511_14629 [Dorcoceras hygrometricum]